MLLDAFSKGLTINRAAATINDDGAHWVDRMIGNAHVLVGNYKDPVTGKALTVDDVLACSVMWKGINLIAGTLANTSIDLKRKVKNGNEIVQDHPVLRILNKPTATDTWFEFMQTSLIRYFLFGSAISEILFDGNYQPYRLSPLEPWNVRPWLLPNGEMEFHTNKWGKEYKFHQSQVHRLKGPSVDGYIGAAAANYAAKAIMTLRSFDEYALRFFTADAVPPIILKVKGRPDVAEKRTIRDAWEKLHAGITNSRKVGVIGQDIDVESLNQGNNRDNQLTEQQVMMIQHCARFLQLPNHALNDLTKSAFSNISQQMLELLIFTFAPLMTHIGGRMSFDLLNDAQRMTLFFEFDPYDLRWADPIAQSEQLTKEVQGGIRTTNEARKRLGEQPHEDGDHLMFNGTMTPLGLLIEQQMAKIEANKKMAEAAEKGLEQSEQTDSPDEEETAKKEEKTKDEKKPEKNKKKETEEAFRPLFLHTARRMAKRAADDLEKASKTKVLTDWAPGWLAHKHLPDMRQNFEPVLSTFLAQIESTQKTSTVLDSFLELVSSSYSTHVKEASKNPEHVDVILNRWRSDSGPDALVDWLISGVD